MKTCGIIMMLGVATSSMAQEQQKPCSFNPDVMVLNLPQQELTEVEKNQLLRQLVQEKLLKDVYTKFYEKWKTTVFKEIPNEEQRHGRAVDALLNKYQLVNPDAKNTLGVFSDEKLTKLYNEWVTQGMTSPQAALQVGVTLEETDIVELEKTLSTVDNFDIQFVYKQLIKGSRNHLRELVKSLQNEGGSFKPSVLSDVEFKKILASPKEKHLYDDPNILPCTSPKQPQKLVIEGKPHEHGQPMKIFSGVVEKVTIVGQIAQQNTDKTMLISVFQYAPFQFAGSQLNAELKNTQFMEGSEMDLQRNPLVEVKGRWNGKHLEAQEIKFIREAFEQNVGGEEKNDDDD